MKTSPARDLNAEAASLTPEEHDAAFAQAAVEVFTPEAVDAHLRSQLEQKEQALAEAQRDVDAAKASGDEHQIELSRRMRFLREVEFLATLNCQEAVRPFVRRARIRQANLPTQSRQAAPRPRERREQHVARATSSADGGDDSGPEPDPSGEEHAGRVCAVPDCSNEVTGRQVICPRCRGRLKKRRQRERRRQARAAEARFLWFSARGADAIERAELEFAQLKALMESNGIVHHKARRERVAA